MNEHSFIELSNISKKFNHVQALDNVSINAYKGEVYAIVGDNGAGKSTLIKILSGVLEPDSGKIRIGNDVYKNISVELAIRKGISTIYQDLALGNSMDVSSNIFLGNEITRHGILCKSEMDSKSTALIKHLGISIDDINIPVGNLSGGQRQGVAVARLVHKGGSVLIFDEPTAAMGINESRAVLDLITRLRDKGMAVILISHNLMQVFEISDRIAVLRHGQIMKETKTKDTTTHEIVSLLTDSPGSINRKQAECI